MTRTLKVFKVSPLLKENESANEWMHSVYYVTISMKWTYTPLMPTFGMPEELM